MRKKLLSWVVTLALLLGMLPGFPAQTARAEGTSGLWTEFAEIPTTRDSAGRYEIDSAAKLAGFAKGVNNGTIAGNASAALTADITGLGAHYWVPIGTKEHNFSGAIYGDYHTVSGLVIGDDGFVEGSNGAKLYGFLGKSSDAMGEEIALNNILFDAMTVAVTDPDGNSLIGLLASSQSMVNASGIEVKNPSVTVAICKARNFQIIGNGTFSGVYVNGGSITVNKGAAWSATDDELFLFGGADESSFTGVVITATVTVNDDIPWAVANTDAYVAKVYKTVAVSGNNATKANVSAKVLGSTNGSTIGSYLGKSWTVVNTVLRFGSWRRVNVTAGNGGKASVNSTGGMFQTNRTATITITPNTGYQAATVTVTKGTTNVAVDGSGNSRTFTMPEGDVTVAVTFALVSYSIAVNTASGGSIVADKAEANYNETITLSATADSGYALSDVLVKQGETTIPVSGSGDTRTFAMPAGNVTITPSFVKAPAIEISTPENGIVTVLVNGSEIATGAKVAQGTIVTLTNTPETGYGLQGYSVKKGTTDVSVSNGAFEMPDGDVIVTAVFTKSNFLVTVQDATDGTVSTDKSTAKYGDTVTLTLTPIENYRLKTLTVVDGNDNPVSVSGSDNSRTFSMPASNVTVSAEFEEIPPELKWTVKLVDTPATGYYEGGDKIVADVYVSGVKGLDTIVFSVWVPEGLELDGITLVEDVTDKAQVNGGAFVWNYSNQGNGKLNATNETKIATITYSILDGAETGNKLVGVDSGYDSEYEVEFTYGNWNGKHLDNAASSVYALNADVKNIKVSLAQSANGSIGREGTFYAKYNTTELYTDMARTNELANWATDCTPTPGTGYVFAGWFDASESLWNSTMKFTADKSLTAKFTTGEFNLTESADNATVHYNSGTSDNDTKVTYLTPVKFTITTDDSYAVKSVSYTVGGNSTPNPLNAANNVYTIPGDAITDAVTITVTTQHYYAISFAAGNTAFGTKTYYVAATSAGLHNERNCTDAIQTINEPDPNSGYRLDTNSGGTLRWAVHYANSEFADAEIITDQLNTYTFLGDATVTPKTVKIWRVTFELTDASHGGAISAKASQDVDNGKRLVFPTFDPFDPGYEVTGYTTSANPDEVLEESDVRTRLITADTTYRAIVGLKEYFVATSASDGAVILVDSYVTHGSALTFTVQVSGTSQLQSVSYAIGDGAAKPFSKADNDVDYKTGEGTFTFTIAGEEVTDYVTINAVMEGEVSVTVTAGEGGTVNGVSSASKTYINGARIGAQDFLIEAARGRTIIAPQGVTVDNDGYVVYDSVLSEDETYAFAFTFGYQTYSVTGATPETATYLTPYTWTPSVDGAIVVDAKATVGGNAVATQANPDGTYTIAGEDILGDIVVTYVTANAPSWEFITRAEYGLNGGLEKGTKIAILRADPPTGGAYALDDVDMFLYSGANEKYSNGTTGYMQIVPESWDETTLTYKLSIRPGGTNKPLTNSNSENSGVVRGSLTGGKKVTGDDISILSAILTSDPKVAVTPVQRLSADITGDGKVNAQDLIWLMKTFVGIPPNI